MPSSLLTAVSGLVAHQRMLDVVANNVANLNTTAFKSSKVLFSDLLYTTIRPATGAAEGDLGGTNPNQVGSGVKAGHVAKNFNQGNLEQTGETFDFAIQGGGFFVLNDGTRNLFTRAGSFSVDSSGTLVDPATGSVVQRFGTLGEPTSTSQGFQSPGDNSIKIPIGASIPGEATTELKVDGNLNGASTRPRKEVLTSANPFTASGLPATTGTLLNDLDTISVPYAAGDVINIIGTASDGAPINVPLGIDGTTTVGDLLAAISSNFSDATATLTATGEIVLQADTQGESRIAFSLNDEVSNTGSSNFSNHTMLVTEQGRDGDIVSSSVEVFDVRGGAHTVFLKLQKTSENTWDLTATLSPEDGVVLDGSLSSIRFHDNGQFDQIGGTGLGDAKLTFQFNEISEAQTVTVSTEQLTHLVADSVMAMGQDGFASGTLISVNVDSAGVLNGVATNGRELPIAQLALAHFSNPEGLISQSDNYYSESLNTGPIRYGTPLSGGLGMIRAGQLEGSNVDIALEFTRLIVAQRGFSANARTISVSDEVLEELVNVVR